jgi:RHS repeat-associated protein
MLKKKCDNKTGLYYYGARYYASWLCRFVSVDPMADEYPYYTPYQYAGNKPITFIDLDGAEPDVPSLAKSDNTNIQSSVDTKRMAFEFSKQQQKEQSQKLANLLSGTGVGSNTPTLSPGKSKTTSQIKEEKRKTRQIEAQQNYEQLKKDVSATSPFVGGGGDFGFGFASTTATALQEAPFLLAPELMGAKAVKFLNKAGKVGRAIEGSKGYKTIQPFASAFIFDASTAGVAQSINRFAATGEISFKPGEIDLANAFIKGIFSTAFGKQFGKDNPLASVIIEEGVKTLLDANIDNGIKLKSLDQSNEILAEFGLRLAFKAIPGKDTDSFGNTISKPGKEFVIETIKKESRGYLNNILTLDPSKQ